MSKFSRANGSQMGCTDTSPPEKYTPAQLSRVHEALVRIDVVLGEETAMKLWEVLPYGLKVDYVYSNWRYEEEA